MINRNNIFLSEITPVLNNLKSRWFDPSVVDSACMYCDCYCGANVGHDSYCILEKSKQTLEKFIEIDNNPSYLLNWKGEPFSEQDTLDIRRDAKIRFVLAFMFSELSSFIPLDLEDPNNEGVACSCNFDTTDKNHAKDCPYVLFAAVLSNYLNPYK